MANQKRRGSKTNTGKTKRGYGLPLVAVIIVVACLVVVMGNHQSKGQPSAEDGSAIPAQEQEKSTSEAVEIAAGESLVIPLADITEDAVFIPVTVDGTELEVIAVRDSTGRIGTAFNTCQICYSSGRGYYVQQGDVFVCQNCGNQFTADQIGLEAGGCNPWPVTEDQRTVTGDAVEISYDVLSANKAIFANWKAG